MKYTHLRKADVLEDIGLENLEVVKSVIADVLDIMAVGRRDVS